MPRPLPPEMHDFIVDFLHDERAALNACCLVSKSWVPRTRRHLFAHIEFQDDPPSIFPWMTTFPDPSNSPAHSTRSLVIRGSLATAAPCVSWIRAFSSIVRLHLDFDGSHLTPLHGFSHTLKSLHLNYRAPLPPSEIFGFVCSFPLLEDLLLAPLCDNATVHEWSVPSTSSKFTGTLRLRTLFSVDPIIRYLMELPDGLRFTRIELFCISGDAESVTNLVSSCSGTLKSLWVSYNATSEFSALTSAVCQCLTTVCEHSPASTFDQPIQPRETRSREV